MDPTPAAALREHLATSPHATERQIASLLVADLVRGNQSLVRLQRFHRKVDVAKKIMVSYDEELAKATSTQVVSGLGYLGLAHVFAIAASNACGDDDDDNNNERKRADVLRWVNSALNCLDLAGLPDPRFSTRSLEAELMALVTRGIAS